MRHLELRPGVYRDSVALMRVSTTLGAAPGVDRALVAMATPVNIELLTEMGFAAPAASPNDLMVALIGEAAAIAGALERLEAVLDGPGAGEPSTTEAVVTPRTTASAARGRDGGLALVSTPGPHAFVEAMDALDAGLNVMIFSDNVPVAQEVRLKRHAAARGLLVMGPDCGTAVVSGVGLGFANVVRPGPVGLVCASGTGAQQVMALLAAAGVGVSHCLGVGGRDLSSEVGAISTHTALDALDADPETSLIVVLSKPPAAAVAQAVQSHADRLATPTVASLGFERRGPLPTPSVVQGTPPNNMTAVVAEALSRLGVPAPDWPSWAPPSPATRRPGPLRALYGGGTLCTEAQAVVSAVLGPVRSNVPLRPEWTVDGALDGHVLLDLGADEYTAGRPHPMLDPTARLPHLEQASDAGVILLDVVLGHGAHPDPASVLAPAIATAGRPVVVALVGTPDDPQGLSQQGRALAEAGAHVYLSNAEAARHAAALAGAAP